MAREFIKGQTIDYYVLYALESAMHQACHMQLFLKQEHGLEYTRTQISGSLQRVKSDGLASYDCRWDRIYKAKAA
ncbi:MAG: hypothetical protein RPR40_13765 [Bermanella sp.]